MRPLANELSWSRTRISTLQVCRRQYYYQYYQKWGGWEWDAAEPAQRAYMFSKMTNLAMLLGQAVHRTIKRVLEDVRDHGRIRLQDPALYARKEILTRTWRAAEQGLWRQSLKQFPPMFELYYEGERPEKEDLKAIGARATQCLDTFLRSDLFAQLLAERPKDWLAVDDEPEFDDDAKVKLDGRTIWALPDFARRVGDTCEIWDWKTGFKNANDERQLLAYALYARDRWGFDAGAIRLLGFYLSSNEVAEYACDADRLADVENEIRRDFELMSSLLEDVEKNVPADPDERFPMCDDRATCARCFYKELCGR